MKGFGAVKQNILEEASQELRSGVTPGKVFSIICRVFYHLRKVFLSIPVIYYALKLAAYNRENLPAVIGWNLQSNGEFAQIISLETAVTGPLLVTAACLGLMFLSRKCIYPWIISIFSLVLPILLLLTNQYPM